MDQQREVIGVGGLAVDALTIALSNESRMPDRSSCLRIGLSSGIGFIEGGFSVAHHGRQITVEAAAAGVGVPKVN